MPRLVLTGATGGLGYAVLKHLLALVPPTDLVIASPDPKRVRAAWPGLSGDVTLRECDFLRPETLPAAFAGADTLFVVSYPSIAHEERVRAHCNAIDAAKSAGVRRIFYTSLVFADDSKAVVMHAHLDTEMYLKKSGIEYTIIREGIYAQVFPMFMGFFDAGKDEEVFVPGDGPVAWAAREELGEATARIIADGLYTNKTVRLSGPAKNALTLGEVAGMCSCLLSRPVARRVVSEEEYIKRHVSAGNGDAEFLRQWATTYRALEAGETGVVSPALEELLGRPARSMLDCMKEHLEGQRVKESIEQYAK